MKYKIRHRIREIAIAALVIFTGIFLFSSCGTGAATSNGEKFSPETKVMTFNIRYGAADDGDNSWDKRKNILIETIRSVNPDIIGLQEALKFQIDQILTELPGYTYVGVGRDDGKTRGEYSAILIAAERFIVDTSSTFWFSETPNIPGSKTWGNEIPRICTQAKIFDKFSGKDLMIFNLHLDHLSQPSRLKSAEQLSKILMNYMTKIPIIVTGDFNCGEDNEAIRTIKSTGMIETYRFLHQKNQDEGTFHGFTGDRSGDKIDYIFVSNDFDVVASDIIYSTWNGKYPSDHFPVTARIKLVKK